jgi:hypothetical protein
VSWQWVIELAPSVATLGAASFGLFRGQGRLRRNLHSDVEIAKELPDSFAGKDVLMTHIEWEITNLHTREARAPGVRRDWPGLVVAVILALGGGYGTVWLFEQSAWWRWVGLATGTLAAVGLYGIAETLQVKKRDSAGRTIEGAKDDKSTSASDEHAAAAQQTSEDPRGGAGGPGRERH